MSDIEWKPETATAQKIAPRSAVRVAVVQFATHVGLEHQKENAASAWTRLERAAAAGANLIVLPELATTGYAFRSRSEAYAHAEPVPGGSTLQRWAEFAAMHDIYLVGCIPERDGARLFDTAVLVGPGGFIGKYRKTHLWQNEKLFFTPGDAGYPVFETEIGRIGLLICWDLWFPEAARIVALQGADIICVPTGWVWAPPPLRDESGRCMASYLVMAAAHVNSVFIAAADRVGVERGTRFIGNSLIAGTNGWPVGKVAGPDEDVILYADMDLAHAREAPVWNTLNDIWRDRRTDLYDPILGYRKATVFPR